MLILRSLAAFNVAAFFMSATAAAASLVTADWSTTLFGVGLSVLLAGFAGSVCALSFLPPLPTRPRVFGAVAIGTLVSAYGVQIAGKYLGWSEGLPPMAFFIGLGAHIGLTQAFMQVPDLIEKLKAGLVKRSGGGS
jgi:uncharacterized membrane protein YedE/YeeE